VSDGGAWLWMRSSTEKLTAKMVHWLLAIGGARRVSDSVTRNDSLPGDRAWRMLLHYLRHERQATEAWLGVLYAIFVIWF
jgi:hypothetical protein